jgi:hypothetical protein
MKYIIVKNLINSRKNIVKLEFYLLRFIKFIVSEGITQGTSFFG